MILRRSKGLTTVLDAAPAHPPAKLKGLERCSIHKKHCRHTPTKYEATSGDTTKRLLGAGGDEVEAVLLDMMRSFDRYSNKSRCMK